MRHNLEKEHLLELTLAVYKVTAIFPIGKEEDDSGSKIRQSADKILFRNGSVEEIIGLLDSAEAKNWVDPRNFFVLRREYSLLRPGFNKPEKCAETVENSNNHRQEKIMAVLNGNGAVRISDLIKLFPGVNRRTVLRDLDELCQVGAMVRNGHGRGVYYIRNAVMSQ